MNRRACAAAFALALAVRLAAAWWLDAPAQALAVSNHEHASIARNLAAGRGFRFNFFGDIDHPLPTSQQAPLVPGVLAGCYYCFGVEARPALAAMIGLQCAWGALAAAWLAAAGARVGGARYGVVLGLLAALHPPLVVAATHVQALAWNLGWLALLLFAAASWAGSELSPPLRGAPIGAGLGWGAGRQPLAWLWFAVAVAGGALTDPILLAPAGAMALWLLPRVPKREWLSMAIVAMLLLTPWTMRNYFVHGRFVLVKNSFGYVFWQGNTPGSCGTDKLPPKALPAAAADPATALRNADAIRAGSRAVNDLLSVADLRELAALPSESARMDWFAARIRRELAAEPWQYPRMCLRRLWMWAWFDDTNPRSALWQYRVCWWMLLALAAAGWQRGLPQGLRQWGWAGLALTAVHVFAIGSARFRIPAEMLLLAAAAGAFAPANRGGSTGRCCETPGAEAASSAPPG